MELNNVAQQYNAGKVTYDTHQQGSSFYSTVKGRILASEWLIQSNQSPVDGVEKARGAGSSKFAAESQAAGNALQQVALSGGFWAHTLWWMSAITKSYHRAEITRLFAYFSPSIHDVVL
jgi:hypothetical protein